MSVLPYHLISTFPSPLLFLVHAVLVYICNVNIMYVAETVPPRRRGGVCLERISFTITEAKGYLIYWIKRKVLGLLTCFHLFIFTYVNINQSSEFFLFSQFRLLFLLLRKSGFCFYVCCKSGFCFLCLCKSGKAHICNTISCEIALL